jgi:hypothetical protein
MYYTLQRNGSNTKDRKKNIKNNNNNDVPKENYLTKCTVQ